MSEIELLDVVSLTEDVLAAGLARGERGAVVEVLAPDVFLVEFVDAHGRTRAMEPLAAKRLHREAGTGGGRPRDLAAGASRPDG